MVQYTKCHELDCFLPTLHLDPTDVYGGTPAASKESAKLPHFPAPPPAPGAARGEGRGREQQALAGYFAWPELEAVWNGTPLATPAGATAGSQARLKR